MGLKLKAVLVSNPPFSEGSGSLPCGPIWTKLGVKVEDHGPFMWFKSGHSVTKRVATVGCQR